MQQPSTLCPLLMMLIMALSLTSCVRYQYIIKSKPAGIEQRDGIASTPKLKVTLDTALKSGRQIRLSITNMVDKPLLLHTKYGSLSYGNTIISMSPFLDDPHSEYSYSTNVSSSIQEGGSKSGVNLYALSTSDLGVARSSGVALGSSSGTTVTRKPMGEIVIYPNQTYEFYLGDFISSMLTSGVEYKAKNRFGVESKRVARLSNTDDEEVLIDQDIETLRKHLQTTTSQAFSLSMVCSDLDGADKQIVATSYGLRTIELTKDRLRTE